MIDLTIICENKIGMLSSVTGEFEKRKINLADISVHVLGEKGIITLSVEDSFVNEARTIIASLGYTPLVEHSVIIRLPDRTGALSEVAHLLENASINIESLRIFDRKDREVFVALTTDNSAKTREVLRDFDARKTA